MRFALLALALVASIAQAQQPGITRYAWDIEIYPGALGPFLHKYADADAIDQTEWRTSFKGKGFEKYVAARYLELPDAYAALPEEVQKRLSQGLDPTAIQIVVNPKPIAIPKQTDPLPVTTGLLGADGKPVTAPPPAIEHKSSGLIVPNAAQVKDYTRTSSGLLIPTDAIPYIEADRINQKARENWRIIQQRWVDLVEANPAEAIRLVKFSKLKPSLMEEVYGASKIKSVFYKLKNPRPKFMSRVALHKDMLGPMELTLHEDYIIRDRKVFTDKTRQICQAFGCSSLLTDPYAKSKFGNRTAGIHYHLDISRAHPPDGIAKVMKKYRLKTGLQSLLAGKYGILQRGINGYTNNWKGNISQIDKHHYEIREPTVGMEELLDELEGYFAIPEGSSSSKVLRQSQARLTEDLSALIGNNEKQLREIAAMFGTRQEVIQSLNAGKVLEPEAWEALLSDLMEVLGKRHPVLQELKKLPVQRAACAGTRFGIA